MILLQTTFPITDRVTKEALRQCAHLQAQSLKLINTSNFLPCPTSPCRPPNGGLKSGPLGVTHPAQCRRYSHTICRPTGWAQKLHTKLMAIFAYLVRDIVLPGMRLHAGLQCPLVNIARIVTARCPSVRPSAPTWADCRKPAASGLLLKARSVGDMHRLLQQRQANVGSATLSAYVHSVCLIKRSPDAFSCNSNIRHWVLIILVRMFVRKYATERWHNFPHRLIRGPRL